MPADDPNLVYSFQRYSVALCCLANLARDKPDTPFFIKAFVSEWNTFVSYELRCRIPMDNARRWSLRSYCEGFNDGWETRKVYARELRRTKGP